MDIDKVAGLAESAVRKFGDSHQPTFLIIDGDGAVVPQVFDGEGDVLAEVQREVDRLGSREYWSVTLGWI